MERKVRVRFAPSPTGPLHIGGVRTALFNYLFAKKHGGDFLLRIEDTDQNRFVEGAEDYIQEALAWCGISPDEGIKEGGDFGPYRQSERKDIYKKYALELVEKGNAYYAFDTSEEIDTLRKKLEAEKSSIRQYGPATRLGMKNSLTLSDEETQSLLNANTDYVIRFKMPEQETVHFEDIIRGKIQVNTSNLDDKVLFKSDGMPTYHLANIVDDYLMQISHVIRGEEWLPSLTLHVMLYRSFGWEEQMPQFAHLPLLLKPVGKGKLSKRDGDKMGFPVFPLEWKTAEGDIYTGYREDGYLPEAFINLLSLLGWNSGTEQEIFSKEELVKLFDLEKVSHTGARFDPEKSKWFNQQYVKDLSGEELAKIYFPQALEMGLDVCESYVAQAAELMKQRIVLLPDFWKSSIFFFKTPTEYTPKLVKKQWKEGVPENMEKIHALLSGISDEEFTTENTEEQVKKFIADNELNMGKILNPLRLLMTGIGGGPHLFDILSLLGKDEVLVRIKNGIENIQR